ncbi:hypothetical protein DPEC_G00058000 [Dallia pectoralis]|uniref:Uncharacterized protein n=1 Tax=Dallia pectoralis TaxID=75939 RepID=A0ACC2H6A8_DALPE|nr:hypothetical protein DPEC_G00058000 [Dallia pectoralis]
MAKIQHGNSSSKKVNNAKITQDFQLHLDSSDDDGPEEVTFEDSKTSALRSMKEALETVKREKNVLKEKRRKRQELFQKQKKRKLLPADVLEEIETVPPKKQNLKAAEDSLVGDEGSSSEESGGSKRTKTKKTTKDNEHRLRENYSIIRLGDQSVGKCQQQRAMDFIQSRLYGPGSQRTTSNQLLSLQNKRGQHKSAAVQFVNEKWGTELKAKAEKMKKRWIHKQWFPQAE